MKLGTILAIARARQYEAEFDSIMEEWNRNVWLRSLLLTLWLVEETMYLPEWSADAYQAPHGSLYWHLIELLKTRLIISMPKKYMTFQMVFEE